MGTFDPLSGDRIFANNNGHFEDVTKASKINSTAISYGLGVVMSDINLDGWVDIYAGNDFHENDYLYINQKNGSFKDEQKERVATPYSLYLYYLLSWPFLVRKVVAVVPILVVADSVILPQVCY